MIVSNGPIVDVSLLLAMNKDQWDPEFLKAIPIMKTRSGMQVRPASNAQSVCVCVCVYIDVNGRVVIYLDQFIP